MPYFSYIARTRAGERVEGTVQATDRRSAVAHLDRQGCVPVLVKEAGLTAPVPGNSKKPSGSPASLTARRGSKSDVKPRPKSSARKPEGAAAGRPKSSASARSRGAFSRMPRMGMRDILLFSRELSDLLASGMMLGDALNTLAKRETSKSQDRIVAALRDDIVQGASLSDALAKHPASFSKLYTSMVRAGEASGTLPQVLERLCQHYERLQDAQEKVLMAMVYPSIIMGVGALTVVFCMVFVIPRFSAIFDELGSDLPATTRLLTNISQWMMTYWWAVLLGGAAGYLFLRRFLATEVGRTAWHSLQLKIPLLSGVICASAFSQFARTLGALLANGVPVLQALSIVENTVGNSVIAREVSAARERVTDGSTISGPLSQGKVFPRLLTDMLAVGEQSGDMSGALNHIANRYERELDRTVKIVTTVLEPIMILLMAVVVGFIAISMLSAVFNMTSGLNM